MIKLIVGSKGSGKTKKIIDFANSIDAEQNDAVFITDTNRYVYEIKSGVRFVNSADFGVIKNTDSLLGFLGGLIAGNNDLGFIFIDGIARITKKEVSKLKAFFASAEKLVAENEATLVFTISLDESELPKYLLKYEK
ncbi:MAG: hypothetical protein LBT20_04930 [Clostridiales bacterium]|jgi:thymidine kinase|nr:hypothetical protein [Clostridiales bacterium]